MTDNDILIIVSQLVVFIAGLFIGRVTSSKNKKHKTGVESILNSEEKSIEFYLEQESKEDVKEKNKEKDSEFNEKDSE